MKIKLIMFLVLLWVNSFSQKLPITNLCLSDVLVVTGGGCLNDAFTYANPSYFDPAYAVSGNCLDDFRNYGQSTNPCSNPSIGTACGGGIVFYILQSGDYGYVSGETHGLIAATSDVNSSCQWGCWDGYISGTVSTLGYGNANTLSIESQCSDPSVAYRLCLDYTSGGYSDWYLPSRDELYKLYLAKSYFTGFANDYYWSSTQATAANKAKEISFANGSDLDILKTTDDHARAIRSF